MDGSQEPKLYICLHVTLLVNLFVCILTSVFLLPSLSFENRLANRTLNLYKIQLKYSPKCSRAGYTQLLNYLMPSYLMMLISP